MQDGGLACNLHLDDLLNDVAIVVAHITGVHLHVEVAGVCCQLDLQVSIGKLQRPLKSATTSVQRSKFRGHGIFAPTSSLVTPLKICHVP